MVFWAKDKKANIYPFNVQEEIEEKKEREERKDVLTHAQFFQILVFNHWNPIDPFSLSDFGHFLQKIQNHKGT